MCGMYSVTGSLYVTGSQVSTVSNPFILVHEYGADVHVLSDLTERKHKCHKPTLCFTLETGFCA